MCLQFLNILANALIAMKQTRHSPSAIRPPFPFRDALDTRVGAVMAHPDFDAAIAQFCGAMATLYAGNAHLRVGMAKTVRWSVAALILHFDAVAPGSVTATALARLCKGGGLGGGDSVAGALDVFKRSAMVRLVSGPGRSHVIYPTDAMSALMIDGLAARLSAVELVIALPAPAACWAAAPGVVSRWLGGVVSAYADHDFRLYDDFPQVRSMMDRHCGYLVLLALLGDATVRDGRAYAALNPIHVATKYAVSRTHVSKLIAAAVEQGWLTREGGVDVMSMSAETYDELRRWVATELAWIALLTGL